MLDFALRATRNRHGGAIRCAMRAIGAAALATVLYTGSAGAQTTDGEPSEGEAEATAETVSDPAAEIPTTAEPQTAEPSNQKFESFVPTERIEAESVISFPANI